MTMADGTLTPDDYTYYQVQKRRIRDTYGQGLAQGMYQGSMATRQRDRQLADLKRKYQLSIRKLPQSYARRGLLNSGLYNRAGYDLERANRLAERQIRGGYQDQLSGIKLAGAQLKDTRNAALSDIDLQQAARKATAASIRGF